MHQKQVIAMNKQYVKSLKVALEHLDNLSKKKNRDRLDYSLLLASMITLMMSSCQGWSKYCNVVKLNELFKTTEDIKKVVEKMLELVTKWVQIDIEVTTNEIKKMESKKTSSKKKRKSSKTKTTYVA